jgi:hypothetical protein
VKGRNVEGRKGKGRDRRKVGSGVVKEVTVTVS